MSAEKNFVSRVYFPKDCTRSKSGWLIWMEYLEFHKLCGYSGGGKGWENEHREIERGDEIDERGSFASRRGVFVSTNNFRKMECN